jgi:NADH-quinone oxidoreductase subunit N
MPTVSLFTLFAPAALVLLGGLAVLGGEPFIAQHRSKHAWLPWIAAVFLLIAGLVQATVPEGQLHGIFAIDTARLWLCEAVIGSTLIALAGLQQSLDRDDYAGGEPYALTLFAAAGALLMVMAVDTLSLFVGLEIASLSIYALVGLRRHRKESNEGLFKYFTLGAVFSAVLLYGAALTYGATGTTHFGAAPLDGRDGLFLLGQTLLIIGLLFKVGVVPFHFWSPDAYTGAPAAVTGFMGAVIKIGGFTALGAIWLNLVAIQSGSHPGGVLPLLATITVSAKAASALQPFTLIFLVLAIVSIIIGNLSALTQSSIRRLVAYSSVAHAGYMLLALPLPEVAGAATATYQLGSLWFYLVGYGIATAGALTAIAALAGKEDQGDQLHALAGQGRAQPFHGLMLTVFVSSFAGVPPTVGFLGKFLVFGDLVSHGYVVWAIAAMFMAVVGAAYYFKLLVTLWSAVGKTPAVTGTQAMTRWTLGAAAVAVVLITVIPNAITRPATAAAPAPAATAAPAK